MNGGSINMQVDFMVLKGFIVKKNVLALSISIAVLALSTATTAQASSIAELQAELAALQQQVSLLKQAPAVDTQAQTTASDSAAVEYATSSDIDGIRADLENFKYDEARLRERNTAKTARDSTLYGVVQVRVQAQDEPTAAGNPAPNSVRRDSFDVPTALIGVRGNLFRDYKEGKNLDYQVSFAYAKRATAGGASDLNLADAFVRYNVLATTGGLEGDRINVTLGQQLIPFGLEAQAPEDLRPTIDVATTPAQLGLFSRQVGAIVRGDLKPYVDYSANYRAPLLEYAFGVFNGNGANKLDDNNGKDYIARAAFTLPVDYASVFRELKFGASYLKGTKNVTNAAGSSVLDGGGKRDRLGFDIYYNHAPYGATYEYIQGRTDWADANNQIREVKSEGHTLTLFYTFGDQFYNSIKSSAKFDDFWPKSIQPYYRYDSYDPNSGADVVGIAGRSVGEAIRHSLGLNIFFAQTTKFQLALTNTDYKTETAALKDFNEVKAQIQYAF